MYAALAAPAADSRPPIVTRAGWGADESWRRGSPQYAGVRMAFIHHTAGTTEYTPEQAPAIVRAVYYYHTKVLGWSDIGYNFLIDRYGTIYQGRRGSMQRGVIGAQTLGFNSHSTGISLMGTFDTSEPTPAMLASLERLLAWKLSLTGVDPLGHATTGVGRQRQVRAWSARALQGRLGAPRRLLHRLPRRGAVRPHGPDPALDRGARRRRADAPVRVGLRGAADDHAER